MKKLTNEELAAMKDDLMNVGATQFYVDGPEWTIQRAMQLIKEVESYREKENGTREGVVQKEPM